MDKTQDLRKRFDRFKAKAQRPTAAQFGFMEEDVERHGTPREDSKILNGAKQDWHGSPTIPEIPVDKKQLTNDRWNRAHPPPPEPQNSTGYELAVPEQAPMTMPSRDLTEELTDTGNKDRLVDRYGQDFRYVPEKKQFLVWNQNKWVVDGAGCKMQEIAEQTAKSWKEDYGALIDRGAIQEAEEVGKWIRRSLEGNKLRAVQELAKKDARVVVSATHLDTDPWLLGVQNGVVEMPSANFRRASREDLITKSAGTEYRRGAGCSRWIQFLDEVMEGDTEMISYLQKLVGYMLTGDIREQRLSFLYGFGANGKSTFINVLQALMGKGPTGYSTTMDVNALMTAPSGGHGPTPEVAKLIGKRMTVAHEVPEGQRLDEGLVKSLTGGDTITARELYGQPFEFQPVHKLFVVGNHKPSIRGTDDGIWRRLDLIGFNRVFKPEEQDKDLERQLLEELPGILNWAIEGCQLWSKEGLGRPTSVEQATEEYRTEQDVIQQWIDERCDTSDSSAWTPLKVLFQDYREWAKGANDWEMKQRILSQKLMEKGLTRTRRGAGYGFDGIRIRGTGAFEPE